MDRGSTPRYSTNGNAIILKERLQTQVTGLHEKGYQGIRWYLSSTLRLITLRKVPTLLKRKVMNVEKLKEYLETDEGRKATKEFFCKISNRQRIQGGRFKRFDAWIEENDFDQLLYRLILEHDDVYREKCYIQGCEPYPTRKMSFLFNYITDHIDETVEVKELDCPFANKVWEFKGYYFQIIWGQGAIQRIYNKEDLRQIFQI